ncbi:SH3-like domain-containing protein, partial [Mycobacterium sp.]|uniref:SH3-like domain-containing protein n=1 Tax=Mycobacterium sp. TaxID=1785 RepID=UPI0025F3CAA9
VAGHFGGGGVLRYAIESLPPLRYLRDGYFERHLDGLEGALVQRRLLHPTEIRHRLEQLASSGEANTQPSCVQAAAGSTPKQPTQGGGEPSNRREAGRPPRFVVGERVSARNIHPHGHTRLPRYVRGRRGTITRIHPAAVFPDTDAHDLGENAQYVYTVSFNGHDLWGETTEPNLQVRLGLWESYLETA